MLTTNEQQDSVNIEKDFKLLSDKFKLLSDKGGHSAFDQQQVSIEAIAGLAWEESNANIAASADYYQENHGFDANNSLGFDGPFPDNSLALNVGIATKHELAPSHAFTSDLVPSPAITLAPSRYAGSKQGKICCECHSTHSSSWLKDKSKKGAYNCLKCYQRKNRTGVIQDVLADGTVLQRICHRCGCTSTSRWHRDVENDFEHEGNVACAYMCGRCKYKARQSVGSLPRQKRERALQERNDTKHIKKSKEGPLEILADVSTTVSTQSAVQEAPSLALPVMPWNDVPQEYNPMSLPMSLPMPVPFHDIMMDAQYRSDDSDDISAYNPIPELK